MDLEKDYLETNGDHNLRSASLVVRRCPSAPYKGWGFLLSVPDDDIVAVYGQDANTARKKRYHEHVTDSTSLGRVPEKPSEYVKRVSRPDPDTPRFDSLSEMSSEMITNPAPFLRHTEVVVVMRSHHIVGAYYFEGHWLDGRCKKRLEDDMPAIRSMSSLGDVLPVYELRMKDWGFCLDRVSRT